MTPANRIVTWKATTAVQRLVDSLRFLHVHGFVSDRERDKAMERIRKWVARGEHAPPSLPVTK